MKLTFLFSLLFFLMVHSSIAGSSQIKKISEIMSSNDWHLLRTYFEDTEQYESFISHFVSRHKKLKYHHPSSHLYIKGFKVLNTYADMIELIELESSQITRVQISFFEKDGRVMISSYQVQQQGQQMRATSGGNNEYVMLARNSSDNPQYFSSYIDYYLQNNSGSVSERNVEFRQINFDKLKIKFKWCEKILGIQVCGDKTKEIEFGPVISKADVPDDDEFFNQITDLTAFSQSFGNTDYLEYDYIQTAVIVDKGLKQLVFMREGLLPWYYGSVQGEYIFQKPQFVKEIGGFLYVLDKGYINPSIVVLKLIHTPDGNFQVQHLGTLDASSGIELSDPTDIGGFTSGNSNKLLVSDRSGVHVISLDKSTGMPVLPFAHKVFSSVRDPLDLDYFYDLSTINRFDASEYAETAVLITSTNKVISIPVNELDPINVNQFLTGNFVSQLSRDFLFTNLAYMVSEEKWYLTDYYGRLHNLAKSGRYIGSGGNHGTNEWNNELYEPIGITPNTITDPGNPYRYRFIVANKWDYTTGFKIFAPGLSIPDAKVFENLTDGKLYFTFTTSGKWQAVENSTGISFSGVKINGAGVGSSLWNTQIVPGTPTNPGNDLQAYPNVLAFNPSDLPNLVRGWNKVELSITIFKNETGGNETIKKSIDFYWLPSSFTPSTTTGGQAKLNFNSNIGGGFVDFIYKPITIGNQGSFYSNDHKVIVSDKGKITFNTGSTFYSKTNSSNALANFYFAENSKFDVGSGAYICVSSGSSGSTDYHIPEIKKYVTLDQGYKLGTNPSLLPEYSSSTCISPCYYYDQKSPEVMLNVDVDYASGPAFTVTVDPTGTTYSNSVKWEVSKVTGSTLSNTVSKIINGSASTVNLKSLLPYTFEPCTQYRVTLYITCNDVSSWITYGSKDFSTAPVVEAGSNQAVCENIYNVQMTGFEPQGGVWSGMGMSSLGEFTTTSVLKNVPLVMTYSYTDTYGCTRLDTKTITVNSTPVLSYVSNTGPVCAGSDLTLEATFVPDPSTKYYWSAPNMDFSDSSSFPMYHIANAQLEMSGYYYVSMKVKGCESSTKKTLVSIRPLPEVFAGSQQETCNTVPIINMTGHNPTGGTWSGEGISSSGVFSTNGLSIGTYPVTYQYTDSYGCINTANKNIVVGPLVTVGLTSEEFCINTSAVTLTGQNPVGGSWSGTGVTSAGVFTPSVAGVGTHTLTYTYTNSGCTGSATKIVTVKPVQVQPAITGNSSVCIGDVFILDPESYIEGAEYQWTLPDNRVITSPSLGATANTNLSGIYKLKMFINGCSHTDFATKNLTVDSLPVTSDITGPAIVCRNTYNAFFSVVNSVGSTYNWKVPTGMTIASGQGTNSISVNIIDQEGEITVQETNANGCKGQLKSKLVSFSPLPIGASINNPIPMGKLTSCNPYSNTFNNNPINCYGNYYSYANPGQTYGRPSDDIFLEFEVEYPSEVEISLCGSDFDTYLHVLKEDGSLLYFNDDNASICGTTYPSYYNSYLKRSLEKGKYYIVCEGWYTGGNINLQVTNLTTRPGSTFSNPIVLGSLISGIVVSDTKNNGIASCFGNNYSGSFPQASDDIFYKFTVNQAEDVLISMCNSGFDTYLHLLDATGNHLSSNDDSGPGCGGVSSSIMQNLQPGTYYAVVEGYGNKSGNITIDIISTDGNKPGDQLSNAIVIGDLTGCKSYNDSQYTGATSGFGNYFKNTDGGHQSIDVFYKFSLTTATELEFSMCNSNFDTYMHILNSSGNKIYSNDDNSGMCSGGGLTSYLKITLSAGIYYIVCEGYSTRSGTYNLEIKNTSQSCPTTCSRQYVSNTSYPSNLGAYGGITSYTGGGEFNGTYHVLGDIVFKEGDYVLHPGTVFYTESGKKITLSENSTLELNGGILTSVCDDFWSGIVLDMDNPGVNGIEVKTFNNAEISNASSAIYCFANNPASQPEYIDGQHTDRFRLNIQNSRFINNSSHIFINGAATYAASNIISNNLFDNDNGISFYGIAVPVTFAPGTDNYIVKNNTLNNVQTGIRFQFGGSGSVIIENNELTNVSYLGIDLDRARDSKIINNRVYIKADHATAYCGINCLNGAEIENNLLVGPQVNNQTSGIILQGVPNLVKNNVIKNFNKGFDLRYYGISNIKDNVLENCITGIECNASGNTSGNTKLDIHCNVFSNSTGEASKGIHVQSGSISSIGSSASPGGNKFINIAQPVVNDGTSLLTYYRYDAPEEGVTTIYGTKGGSVNSISTGGYTLDYLCGNLSSKISDFSIPSDLYAAPGKSSQGDVINDSTIYLGQNIPNPASNSTEISFFVPKSSQYAYIIVQDIYKSNSLERFEVLIGESGKVRVDLNKYIPGIYLYTLFTDGIPMITKKMVVVH